MSCAPPAMPNGTWSAISSGSTERARIVVGIDITYSPIAREDQAWARSIRGVAAMWVQYTIILTHPASIVADMFGEWCPIDQENVSPDLLCAVRPARAFP